MKNWRGIWLPDGETHLTEWMEKRNEIVRGLPTYQYHKLRAAVDLVSADRRRVALDIGAHCGLWSMHLVHEFDRLIAFEPMAAHRACFLKNVDCDRFRVLLYSSALGEATRDVTMTTGPASSGDTWIRPTDDHASPVAQTATMSRLDDWTFPPVDFVKIDCEGYELPILRGGEETLTRDRPVICIEQKPGHASRFGFGDTDAIDWLKARGWRQAGVMSGDYLMVPA